MSLIPTETVYCMENYIYLPMLLTILERDRCVAEQMPFKFQSPYIELLNEAIHAVTIDLQKTVNYFQHHHLQVTRQSTDELFTEYLFICDGCEDLRRYLNVRLRNRTEELLHLYIRKLERPNFLVP